MKQDRLKNDKKGWDGDKGKIRLYSWIERNGDVCKANGDVIGNYITGNFLLKVPSAQNEY